MNRTWNIVVALASLAASPLLTVAALSLRGVKVELRAERNILRITSPFGALVLALIFAGLGLTLIGLSRLSVSSATNNGHYDDAGGGGTCQGPQVTPSKLILSPFNT